LYCVSVFPFNPFLFSLLPSERGTENEEIFPGEAGAKIF
jgi:hypothetical protein